MFINHDGSVKASTSKEHQKYDVLPYRKDGSNLGNVPGLIYGNTKTQRDANEKYYNQTANLNVFSFCSNLL